MKKFLLFLAILLVIPAFAKAETDNLDIQFSEFCPYKFWQNLDTSKNYIFGPKKYWASRKEKFDQQKTFCMSLDSDDKKAFCINKMRKIQKELTIQRFNQTTESKNNFTQPTDDMPHAGIINF